MAWELAKSLAQLRREVDTVHPDRPKTSDGTIGDTAHAARKSAHNPDSRGAVRAWDCTGPVGHDVAETLRQGRDRRLRLCISRGRIFSSYDHAAGEAWTWRPYSGSNPHNTHAHIEVHSDPALYDDPRPWGFTQEDDVYKQGDSGSPVLRIQKQVNRMLHASKRHDKGPLTLDGQYGPATVDAVKTVQANIGWDVTGTVDAAFLDEMSHHVHYSERTAHAATPHGGGAHTHDEYATRVHKHSGKVTVE